MTDTAQALPENVQKGLTASVKYIVGNLLAEKHYSKISSSLATKWDKFQSLTAAKMLMQQHGVQITPEEEDRLSGLTEPQMIESLVSKMPQQSKEQFQHFFLQLQLIVSTATRIRTALEQGRADLVEQAMEDADSTGISQYILKMAIVQAGSEVNNLKKQHGAFAKDAESKLSRLCKGAEDAAIANERLGKAKAELAQFQATQNENIKKVLMSFAGGSATALTHGVFSSWANYTKKMLVENEIYEDFRPQIEEAEAALIDAKSQQLKSVKGMIERRNAAGLNGLLAEVFGLWCKDIVEAKLALESAAAVAALEARLQGCADQASANAKKVLARCGAASGQGLRDMCFHEWKTFHTEYLKNKEMEDAVKAEEARIAEFMKSHSDNAKGLLNNMAAATDSGLVHEVLTAWYEVYKEEKQINEYAEFMNQTNGRFGSFGDRNKKGAKSVMERAHEHNMTMLYLKFFGAWKLDTCVERKVKAHQVRIDAKRQQLVSVQQMFRNFAKQLESNIQSGADSSRDLAAGPPSKKKTMQKNDGSVSLPDIHSKPGSAGGQ
jgi:hypothetical protein